MIQAFHVYKQYDRESTALYDITLEVGKGEFCFLTGPSGAGKTTFLKLVFREELPSQGQILVGGRNVTAIPEKQIPELRRSIGVVFQDFKLLKRKTILENVAFVLRILSVPKKEQKRRAFAALKSVGLHHKMHAYPLQLSGGEQQRVAIARADQRADAAAGRRADRQPRPRDGAGDHGPVPGRQLAGHHRAGGHARPR